MITHTIEYYDYTIEIEISENDTHFRFIEKDNTVKVLVFDPLPNQYFKKIAVPYIKELWNKDFTKKMDGFYPQITAVSDKYSFFWNLDLLQPLPLGTTLGSYQDSGGVNLAMEHHWDDKNCIPFNTLKGMSPIQPIIFKVETTANSATVVVVNESDTKQSWFALDDDEYQTEVSFNEVTIGKHVMKAKTNEDGYVFDVEFEVTGEIEG